MERVPSVSLPAFDAQGNDVCKGAPGHQRCQIVKTVGVGVAETWALATSFVWGRQNYALPNPQPLKSIFSLGFWSLC